MHLKLRPIDEQVMVITGADSGIGLATARAAAARGARVVICSRSEEGLRQVASEIEAEGGSVVWFACDVADEDAMIALAETAVAAFGRIDTWVNNAGVSVYGETETVPVEDARRLFDTNYWGTVNGSLAALPYLRENGGALINIGSILSDRAIPLQGHYSATKHAVKAFTDTLRMELEKDGAPVAVTLVKPGAIDTPYPEHARNYMEMEPKHPRPVYAPEVVADAIIECAEHPVRSVTVGGGGRMNAMMGILAPRMTDRFMEATMFRGQKRRRPGHIPPEDTLYMPPSRFGRARGDQPGHVKKSSLYTAASLHPGRTVAGLAALTGLGLGYTLAKRAGLLGGVRTEYADTPGGEDFYVREGDTVHVEVVETVAVGTASGTAAESFETDFYGGDRGTGSAELYASGTAAGTGSAGLYGTGTESGTGGAGLYGAGSEPVDRVTFRAGEGTDDDTVMQRTGRTDDASSYRSGTGSTGGIQ